jgi:hypothetical protein
MEKMATQLYFAADKYFLDQLKTEWQWTPTGGWFEEWSRRFLSS